jgi:SAM-dependent methyltransferase
MPSLDWNRRWAVKLARFVPGGREGRHYGDRWGDPLVEPALRAVRARFLDPYVGPGVVALEIGPGGGRWTQFLAECERLYCVEFNPQMFEALGRRFPGRDLVFVTTTGCDLPGVPDGGVDFAFSYGTLVHLEAELVGGYLSALGRALRPGGSACLHVANTAKPGGRAKDGFADNDPDRVAGLVQAAGLDLVEVDDDTLPHSTLVRAVKP